MKRYLRPLLCLACLCGSVFQSACALAQNNQQLIFAGLRASSGKGQFNAVATDSSGNLYLLYDQKDGVRLIKTDANANNVLAETRIGGQGDSGLAMALDPSGNIYVTGTTTSGTLPTTPGVSFPSRTDASTNSFLAKFDATLNPVFVTYAGSGRMAASSIAATSDRVFIAGSIFASTLPVTPTGIIQAPAAGSFGNGFVEAFSTSGTLVYSTYLSGFQGDTAPAAIAADEYDNAYVAGYTTSSGYPTLSALIPTILGTTSGFLSKLTPAGDGFSFSTFLPGSGITSLVLDTASQSLVLSGTVSSGQFPIATVVSPLVSTDYQSAIRLSLDGSRVLSSTLLAPGTQSVISTAPDGAAWAAVTLSTPLLPIPSISSIGSTAVFRITSQGVIDQSIRLGGKTNILLPSLPTTISSIAVGSDGQPIFAGSMAPSAGSGQISTQTYDLPLRNSPTPALPSTLRDAEINSCGGSICSGSGAYLAKFSLTSGPSLALSTDASPNIILRNLGSSTATSLSPSASGFTLTHNCPTQLGPGEECNLLLAGTGPGSITVQSANATGVTTNLPPITKPSQAVVTSPAELDFGIITATTTPQTRTVTATNLGQSPAPSPFSTTPSSPFNMTSDCPTTLAAGASCHASFSIGAPTNTSTSRAYDSGLNTVSPNSPLTITAYLEPSALNLSSTEINFGTQFPNGIRLPRFLYLSNNSSSPIQHSTVTLPSSSPFTVSDRCPTLLEPNTVCQLQLDYNSPQTSADSITLSLDQGNTVLITGRTIPQPGANGSTANPNLTVEPNSVDFPNAVVVTAISSNQQTITVSNTGTQSFPLSLSIAGDFIYTTSCPSVLAGGASCTATLAFAPSQPGARQGLLSISPGAGSTSAYVNLSGTSTGILTPNNGTLDLGTTAAGQPITRWFKITQPFSQLKASTTSDFGVILVEDIGYGYGQPPASAFATTATGTCFNCWLGVQFLPASAGPQSATLSLDSLAGGNPYSLTLSGNAVALTGLLITPAQQDFGPIAVHSSSASTIFTLTNLTSTTVNFSTPTITTDFVISELPGAPACNGSLSPNASCFLQVSFNPTSTGPATGTLNIASETAVATAALSGYGSMDTGLALNPDALIFRNNPGASATQQSITLTNTSIYSLNTSNPTSTSASFTSTTNCNTLTPGATCNITVTFIPSSATATGTLSVPATSSAVGSPQFVYSVSLTGAYTTQDAGLQILPNQTNYGPTTTSTLGLTRQFLINNLTTKSLTLSFALPRQFVLTELPCSALAPGAGCTFSVAFLPLTNGDITGTLFAHATPIDGSTAFDGLSYLDGFGKGSGTLAITGSILPGRILDFAQVASGQTSIRTLTVTNTGTSPVTVRRITSQWPFLSTTTCGTELAPNSTCTVTLTYSPINQVSSSSSPAPFNTDAGTLFIESDAISSPDLINLTGTVTPLTVAVPSNTAPLVSYTASQNSLSYAPTSGGNASAPQTISLTNTGTTTIHISRLATTPDFDVAGSCPAILPGTSCPITITFTPQTASSQTVSTVTSALEIASDSSAALDFISLLGIATPPTLVLSPVSLDFGQVLVGSSATLPIKITNGSPAAATFSSITTSGDYTVIGNCPAPGTQLQPSASCTLQVTFTPSQAGTRTGAVSIVTSLTSLPLIANLTGTGSQSHLQVTPASLTFTGTTVGASASLTLSLANTGTAPVTRIALSVTGDYAIAKPCGATSLDPGASCAITITFTPTATGTRTGTLTVTSSDASSPLGVPLTGIGNPTASIALTVDGATSSSITVKSGRPANYSLSLTPLNGYTGAVILNCTPINPGQYASCSLLPSSFTLTNASPQSSTATINTVTSVSSASTRPQTRHSTIALCLLPFGVLLLRRTRFTLLIALFALTATSLIVGCGSGGSVVINNADPNLRYTPPGTYRYQVTATSANGTPLSQTVSLNLTVTAQ